MSPYTQNLPIRISYLEKLPGLQLMKHLFALQLRTPPSNFKWIDDIDIPQYLIPMAIAFPSELRNNLELPGSLPGPVNTALSSSFDPYHYLSMAIYFFSNNLANRDSGTFLSEWLRTLARIPQNLLAEVLQAGLPGVRAAWETLISTEEMSEHKAIFRLLMDVGIRNEWLVVDQMGHDYLCYAVRANCVDVVKTLLGKGCRPDSDLMRQPTPAIIQAIDAGAFNLARLLVERCDVNTRFQMSRRFQAYVTNFECYFSRIGCDNKSLRGLDLFLENGAEVRRLQEYMAMRSYLHTQAIDFYRKEQVLYWPSKIDCYFETNRSLFLKTFSDSAQQSFRWEILHALEHVDGVNRLRLLMPQLQKDPRYPFLGKKAEKYLQLVFSEQFLMGTTMYSPQGSMWFNKKLNLDLIQRLMDFGVDHTLPCLRTNATDLMCAMIHHIHKEHGMREGMAEILERLCEGENGARIGSRVLHAAVQEQGTSTLDYFAIRAENISTDGTEALMEAALLDNFEAVRLLAASGMDLKTSFQPSHIERVTGNGTVRHLSFRMIQFLAGQGAEVWHQTSVTTSCLKALMALLDQGSPNLLEEVVYLVDKLGDVKDETISYPSAFLLERCLRFYFKVEEHYPRLQAFEYLYRQGARTSPGCPLALFIYSGGRAGLVEDILNSGADANAYSSNFSKQHDPQKKDIWYLTPLQAAASYGNEGILVELLNRGADVNAAALGFHGKTALQHICAWRPMTSEERTRQLRMTKMLLDHGADVNGAPAERYGSTAIQITAAEGDLELATILLERGADVNAPQGPGEGTRAALDAAAYWGRLDMVQLLLDAGAVSSWTMTKYGGAIYSAELQGHFAIADLIQKYIADNNVG